MKRFDVETSLPTWRKMALATWRPSDDPQIYGWIDVEATALLAYVERVRRRTGVRVTLTHVVGKAVAMAFADNPDCNAVATWRGIARRPTVDVFFSVATKEGLSGAKLEAVDELDPAAIASRLADRVGAIRGRANTALQRSQRMLSRMPRGLMRRAMQATSVAAFDLGLDLSAVGVPVDPFGTAVVTNIGTLGLERGLAPLVPSGRSAALFTVGKVRDDVVADDGAAVVRPVLTIGGTFDHRLVDGAQLGRIDGRLREVLREPERFLGLSPDRSPFLSSAA